MKKNNYLIIILVLILIGAGAYAFSGQNKNSSINKSKKNISSPVTKYTNEEKSIYYKMFDKNVILDGKEDNAKEILVKIDTSFNKNKQDFKNLINLDNPNDEKTLYALYLMNFVSFTNPYGKDNGKSDIHSINDLIWKIKESDCQSDTELLAMLLEGKGYENRTVSVDDGYHGFNEVRINGQWQVFDATANIWLDKSLDELMNSKKAKVIKFFLKDLDIDRPDALTSDFDLTYLRIQMAGLGTDFKPEKVKYNFVDFSKWSY